MNEEQLVELLKKNLRAYTWLEPTETTMSVKTEVYYGDTLISHCWDGALYETNVENVC